MKGELRWECFQRRRIAKTAPFSHPAIPLYTYAADTPYLTPFLDRPARDPISVLVYLPPLSPFPTPRLFLAPPLNAAGFYPLKNRWGGDTHREEKKGIRGEYSLSPVPTANVVHSTCCTSYRYAYLSLSLPNLLSIRCNRRRRRSCRVGDQL